MPDKNNHNDPVCSYCGSRMKKMKATTKSGLEYEYLECSMDRLINEDGTLNWCNKNKPIINNEEEPF